MMHFWKTRSGTLLGIAFGLTLVAGTLGCECAAFGLTSASALVACQVQHPMIWLFYTFPLLTGMLGRKFDNAYSEAVARQNLELKNHIDRLNAEHKALEDESHELRAGSDDLYETNILMSRAVRRFEELFQGLPVACFTYDSEGRIVEWNRASEAFFDKAASDVAQKTIWEALPGAENGILSHSNIDLVMAGGSLSNQEWEYRASDGTIRHVLCSVFPQHDADRRITGGISANIDITARREAEENQKRLSDILESTPDFVATITPDGHIRYLNSAARRTIGMRPEAQIGKLEISKLHPPEIAERILNEALSIARQKGIWSGESIILGMRGRQIPHSQVVIAHRDAVGVIQFYSTIARDISLRKHYEEEILQYSQQLEIANASLEELATQDGLTCLYNHRAFQERLKTEWELARRYGLNLSVIMLDVDLFKQYNDAYGHPAGDTILKHVASILRDHARTVDMAARYGGEEFAMVLPSTDIDGALILAERLRTAIETACWEYRPVTASFGVAAVSESMIDRSELIAAADAALYRSKKTGRNRVTPAATFEAQPGPIAKAA